MPSIPQVSPFIPSGTPAPNVTMNPANGMQVGRAISGFGQDITEAAQPMIDYMHRVQNAKDIAGIMDADSIRQDSANAFKEYTASHPDQSTWDETKQKLDDDTRAKVAQVNSGLSPLGQRKLGLMMGLHDRTDATAFKWLKTEQTLKDVKTSFDAQRYSAVMEMDPDKLKSVYDYAVKNGVYDQATSSKLFAADQNRLEVNLFQDGITHHLWAKDIEKGITVKDKDGNTVQLSPALEHIFPQQLYRLRRDQQIQQGFARGAMQRELDVLAEDPGFPRNDNTIIPGQTNEDGSPQNFKQLADQMGIDGKWQDRWMKVGTAHDPEAYARINRAIGDVTPSAFDLKTQDGNANRSQVEQMINSSGLPTEDKAQLRKNYDEMLKPDEHGGQTTKAFALSAAADAFHHAGLVPYVYSPVVKDSYGKVSQKERTRDNDSWKAVASEWENSREIPDSVKREARENYAQLQDLLLKKLDGPGGDKLTRFDLQKTIDEFCQPITEKKVIQAITGRGLSPEQMKFARESKDFFKAGF